MKLLITLFLLLSTISYAQELKENDYSVRIFGGASSASDFDQLYTFTGFNTSPYGTNVYGADIGYKLVENIFDWPFDIYAKAGLSYFDENGHQADFLELTLYVKLVYKLNAFGNQFRFGIAEGGSYAGRVPYVEAQEAIEEGDNQSNFLNYMEITFDFDMGKLMRVKSMENYMLGYLIKHRSGFHGVYNGVNDGGSNYNCVYIEKNF
ncbi:hypothetical protein JHD49_00260 [Sulfurimonas sp. SAG-AH-194-C21]|nr:hypothetical protein [Sulfurimonas sp. SAG-AH-194-C21]MDF1882368.1 hypothetical protein [Sulfurimonas sp. SAG-AH-194-C21]